MSVLDTAIILKCKLHGPKFWLLAEYSVLSPFSLSAKLKEMLSERISQQGPQNRSFYAY
jgi:hypothetical protein